MHCFRHRDKPALGICKSCGKGLCSECFVELANGIACRTGCEERVALINRIVDNNARVMQVANRQLRIAACAGLLVGIVLIGFAVYTSSRQEPFLTLFFGTLGIIATAFSLTRFRKAILYPVPEK